MIPCWHHLLEIVQGRQFIFMTDSMTGIMGTFTNYCIDSVTCVVFPETSVCSSDIINNWYISWIRQIINVDLFPGNYVSECFRTLHNDNLNWVLPFLFNLYDIVPFSRQQGKSEITIESLYFLVFNVSRLNICSSCFFNFYVGQCQAFAILIWQSLWDMWSLWYLWPVWCIPNHCSHLVTEAMGANAILAISMAACRAGAAEKVSSVGTGSCGTDQSRVIVICDSSTDHFEDWRWSHSEETSVFCCKRSCVPKQSVSSPLRLIFDSHDGNWKQVKTYSTRNKNWQLKVCCWRKDKNKQKVIQCNKTKMQMERFIERL